MPPPVKSMTMSVACADPKKFAKVLPYVVRREADIIMDAVVAQDIASASAIADGRQRNADVKIRVSRGL